MHIYPGGGQAGDKQLEVAYRAVLVYGHISLRWRFRDQLSLFPLLSAASASVNPQGRSFRKYSPPKGPTNVQLRHSQSKAERQEFRGLLVPGKRRD